MANPSMDRDLVGWLRQQLQEAQPDLLREMLATMVQELMGAEAQQLCGAEYGERSSERSNSRNGYRERDWDTRAGSIELAVPKLRRGSYFPEWLLEPRRRAERALVTVIAQAYLAGVSTRRVEGLVQTLGISHLSKSQVSVMAKSLDGMVDEFRNRPLDGSPYTYLWVDALTQRCRDGGRVVNVCTAIATGVNADGQREILGIDVFTAEDGAAWTSFLRSLLARGLAGVRLVISDDHRGLKQAIAAVLPGAGWQRCRVHFVRNLLIRVPKSAQTLVATLVRSIFAQPDQNAVWAQHARMVIRRPRLRVPRPRRQHGALHPGPQPLRVNMAPHVADSHDLIRVQGTRVNNLKDVSVEIAKRRLTVFTGVSGSDKSSLVFGTIAGV